MTLPRDAGPEYDFDYVAQRLAEAGMTLLTLQVKGLRPATFRSSMPAPVDTVSDDHRAPPPAKRISQMDQALSWVTLIPPEQLTLRKLVQARALTIIRNDKQVALYSWKTLGRWLGCSDVTVKTWWIGAIELIIIGLNRPGFCAEPQFRGTRHTAIGALEHAADKAALTPIDRIRRIDA